MLSHDLNWIFRTPYKIFEENTLRFLVILEIWIDFSGGKVEITFSKNASLACNNLLLVLSQSEHFEKTKCTIRSG